MRFHKPIVNFFSALSHFAIRHPRGVILIAAILTLAAAPGVMWLRLRTDGHALISQTAPEVVYDKSVRARFGIEDEIVVLIRSDHLDGIFNSGTVQLVRDLTAEFRRIPGITASNVMSLATEPSFRFRPGTLINQTMLEPPLQTKAELDQLREDLRKIQLYTATLVGIDGKSTAILIGAPSEGDRTKLYQRILDTVFAKQPAPEDILVTGAPVAEALLGIHILEDLGVPQVLLGTSTRSHTEKVDWKMPANLYELRLLVARRIGLVPITVAVMMLVFLLNFRNVTATLLPLPEVGAVLLFTFGLMGWFGVPIYLTIAVMPVLLTAMCVTDEIHVFSRYFALVRQKPGVHHVELVKETMDEMVCPVANTTLTTAIGFVSFAFSPLAPVQAFGIFTAAGVLFSLFYSLTVIPAMLTLIPPTRLVSRRQRERPADSGTLAPIFSGLAMAVVRHRYWVIALVAIIIALAPLGLRRLVVQDSWIDGFDPSSEFRRATRLVNEQFHGMHLLLVSFNAPEMLHGEISPSNVARDRIALPLNLVTNPAELAGSTIALSIAGMAESPGAANATPRETRQFHLEYVVRRGDQILARTTPDPAASNFWQALRQASTVRFEVREQTHLRPDILRIISDLGSFIREHRQCAVGGVLSPADYLSTTRFMVRVNDPNARALPQDAAEIKLLWDYYRMARGPHRLRQVVDTNYWQSLTTVFLKDGNFVDTDKLMSAIRAYEREHLTPRGIELGFAGDVAVSQSLIRGIVTTQVQSLFWSLVGIYAVTALLGRSLRCGIYCVLPSTLAVVINFAVMGWFGIPLGVATSMFAGMTLGIGVDFAVHVLEGYGHSRAKSLSVHEALSRSMAQTGPPVLINTIAISLGFGVLMLSQVPANARLGLLVVLGLVDCLLASLLLLPVLLHWWPLKDARDHH